MSTCAVMRPDLIGQLDRAADGDICRARIPTASCGPPTGRHHCSDSSPLLRGDSGVCSSGFPTGQTHPGLRPPLSRGDKVLQVETPAVSTTPAFPQQAVGHPYIYTNSNPCFSQVVRLSSPKRSQASLFLTRVATVFGRRFRKRRCAVPTTIT